MKIGELEIDKDDCFLYLFVINFVEVIVFIVISFVEFM